MYLLERVGLGMGISQPVESPRTICPSALTPGQITDSMMTNVFEYVFLDHVVLDKYCVLPQVLCASTSTVCFYNGREDTSCLARAPKEVDLSKGCCLVLQP